MQTGICYKIVNNDDCLVPFKYYYDNKKGRHLIHYQPGIWSASYCDLYEADYFSDKGHWGC